MNFRWIVGDKNETNIKARRYENQSRLLSLRKRIDGVLVSFIVAVFFTFFLLALITVQVLKRNGNFEAPLIKQLPDERLLVNIRNKQAQTDFLSAAYHQGNIYIGQQDGGIQRYDPLTGLWTTEYPFSNGTLIDPRLIMLRSGCGTDPLSDRVKNCADSQTIWGVSAGHGLVRKSGSKWEVLVGDSAFIGAGGKPVQMDQLNSAAVSQNGNWLMVGTINDGVGLYNLQLRSWVVQSNEFFKQFPSNNITRLAWFQNAFWVGTDLGLVQIEMTGGKPVINRVTDLPIHVMDLDISPEDYAWVLGTLPCENKKELRCTWLGKFTNANNFDTLMNETNRYPELDLNNLSEVQWWDNQVVMAGKVGIVTYQPGEHKWSQLFSEPVQITLDMPNADGFYFVTGQKVGQISNGKTVVLSDLGEGPIVQLTYGKDGIVLAVTASGNAYSVQPGLGVTPIFSGQETAIDPATFRRAIAAGDQVLLVGEKGALLHNVLNRTYLDIDAGFIPSWLSNPRNQFINSGDNIYIVNETSSVYRLKESDVINPEYYTSGEIAKLSPLSLPASAQSWWKWDNTGIGIMTEAGQILLVDHTGVSIKTGISPRDLPSENIIDVAELPDRLAFATNEGIRYYMPGSRQWGPTIHIPEKQVISSLATQTGKLFASTNKGGLLEIDNYNGNFLIAKPYQLHVNDQTLSDVLLDGSLLYLAGNGWVDVYDSIQRTVITSYNLQTNSSVKLYSIVEGKPLTFSDANIYLGEIKIDRNAGTILGASTNTSNLWLLRQGNYGPYLKSYLLSDLTSDSNLCFFRTPSIAGASTLYDARQLPNGAVAATTDAGLFFYSPAARSWYQSSPRIPRGPARLFLTSKYLLAITNYQDVGFSKQIYMIALDEIKMPDSCSLDAVTWPEFSKTVRAVSVDESNGKLLWIENDGKVMRWEEGNGYQVRSSSENGPAMDAVLHFYDRGNSWVFTSRNAIWKYDTEDHRWEKFDFSLPPGHTPVDVNLEWLNGQVVVMVKDDTESFFSTKLDEQFSKNIQLSLLYAPHVSNITIDPELVLDVQPYADNLWGFLTMGQASLYSPIERRWVSDFQFPQSDPSLVWGRLLETDVIQSQNGQQIWVNYPSGKKLQFVPFRPTDGEITAYDSQRAIWRYTKQGDLYKCKITNLEYLCEDTSLKPFFLEPSQVKSVFTWNSLDWFQLGDSLRVYNPANHTEVLIPGYTDNFRGFIQAREYSNTLFLFRPGELLVLTAQTRGVFTTQSYPVQRFIYDKAQTVWAEFTDGWQIFENGNFVKPKGSTDRIFAYDGNIPAAIDGQGQLLLWQGGELLSFELPLSTDIDLNEVIALIPHFNNSWWLVKRDKVLFVKGTLCNGKPCLNVERQVDLPTDMVFESDKVITSAKSISAGLVLFIEGGKQLSLKQEADGTLSLLVTPGQPIISGVMANKWSAFSPLMGKLPDGRQAFDPILEIKISNTGKLIARRNSSEELLSETGVLLSSFQQGSPLNTGWLKWNRGNHSFDLSSSQGQLTFKPSEFLPDGQFIFQSIAAILPTTGASYLTANTHGIWTYPTAKFNINDTNINYTPVRLDGNINAAHGKFYASNGELLAGQSQVNRTINQIQTRLGDVLITEDPVGSRVIANFIDGTTTLPANASSGFLWDSNLQAIAHSPQGDMLQSDAGIFTLSGYELRLSSNNSLLTNGMLKPEAGQAYVVSDEWYKYDSKQWQKKQNPTSNRTLLDNTTWKWSIQNDLPVAVLKNNPEQFHLITNSGVGLSSDQISAAGVSGDQILVLSNAFLEYTSSPEKLGTFTSSRSDPISADYLSQFHDNLGKLTTFLFQGSRVSVWDSNQNRFNVVNQDPRTSWLLASSETIKFSRSGDSVQKTLLTTNLAGGTQWSPFLIDQNRFPFDIINSIASFEKQLYLGTVAGLEYFDPNSTAVGKIKILDLGGVGSFQLTAVQKTGSPLANPKIFMTQTDSNCMEISAGAKGFTPCKQPSAINNLFRFENTFWRWSRLNGQAVGEYKSASGPLTNQVINALNPGFPHDQTIAAISCGQKAYSVWLNGWVSEYPASNFSISNLVLNHTNLPFTPNRFLCLDTAIKQNGAELDSGLYIQRNDGLAFARYSQQTGWQPISKKEDAENLFELLNRPPYYLRSRLRLVSNQQGSLGFEYKNNGNIWTPLPWQDGRVSIDHWSRILLQGNTLWAATSSGLGTFSISPAGIATIDPDQFTLMNGPLQDKKLCEVSDFMQKDGLPWIRCNASSQEVFSGPLTIGKDANSFTQSPNNDPFAHELFIPIEQNKFWQWELKNRVNGSLGEVTTSLTHPDGSKEVTGLFNGQWGFDAIETLAFVKNDQLEMAGPLSGWYQASSSDMALKTWARSTDWPEIKPEDIAWLGTGMTKETASFCLRSTDSKYARIIADKLEQNLTSCPEYQGMEGLWRYDIQGNTLEITGSERATQPITRKLLDGRFSDDFITGMPVASMQGKDLKYLAPTMAGVILFAGTNDRLDLITTNSPDGNWYPSVLANTPELGNVYYQDGNLIPLAGKNATPILSLHIPQTEGIIAVEDGPLNYLRVWVQANTGLSWYLMERETGQVVTEKGLPIIVSGFDVYKENSATWGPSPFLQANINALDISFFRDSSEPPININLANNFELILPVQAGEKFILIGKHDILLANLSRVVRELLK